MTIFRVQHNKNYTTVNNYICKDNRLSYKAKGIWLYAFSRPDDWEFIIEDLINQSTDGRDSVRTGLKELENAGYLKRIRLRDKNGQLGDAEWTFFEIPEKTELKESLPKTENPTQENLKQENHPLPITESLINTENNNKEDVVVSSVEEKEKRDLLLKLPDLIESTILFALPFPLHRIAKAIDCCIYGKFDNVNGFFRDALKNNWEHNYPKSVKEQEIQREKDKKLEEENLRIYNDIKKKLIDLMKESKGKMQPGYGFEIIDGKIHAIRVGKDDHIVNVTEGDLNWAEVFYQKYKKE